MRLTHPLAEPDWRIAVELIEIILQSGLAYAPPRRFVARRQGTGKRPRGCKMGIAPGQPGRQVDQWSIRSRHLRFDQPRYLRRR